jgi:hypothetical protein
MDLTSHTVSTEKHRKTLLFKEKLVKFTQGSIKFHTSFESSFLGFSFRRFTSREPRKQPDDPQTQVRVGRLHDHHHRHTQAEDVQTGEGAEHVTA